MRKYARFTACSLIAAMLLGQVSFAAPAGSAGGFAGLAFATSALQAQAKAEVITQSEELPYEAVPKKVVLNSAEVSAEEAQAVPEELPPETEPETSPYANVAVSKVSCDEDYVNVRDEASTEGEILGKIYNNCAATIEETVEAEDGTWYKIHSGSVEGYIKAEYFVTGDEAEALAIEIGKLFGYVEEGGLRVRTEPNTDSDVITKLYSGEIYNVIESEEEGFVKLSLGEDEDGNKVTGYVAAEYIDVYVKFNKAISLEEEREQKEAEERRRREAAEAEEEARRAKERESKASLRSAIVAYAKQFVGNPYVYGGTSLTNGCDCSGFTMSVYKHFGISMCHSSRQQPSYGRQISLSDVQPGDLVYYANGGRIYHVAMYIGGGKVVHAIDESRGIGISSMYCLTPYIAVTFL